MLLYMLIPLKYRIFYIKKQTATVTLLKVSHDSNEKLRVPRADLESD